MIEAGIIGEDEKFELIEGEIVMMAAKGTAHERIKSALIVAIARALPDHLTLGAETTLRLTSTILIEPDIAVLPRELFRKSASGFAQLDPGEAHLVIEVAPTSLAYDKTLKAPLYARQRVKEYWVIDANERVTWVHTEPRSDCWSSIGKRGRRTRSPRRRCQAFRSGLARSTDANRCVARMSGAPSPIPRLEPPAAGRRDMRDRRVVRLRTNRKHVGAGFKPALARVPVGAAGSVQRGSGCFHLLTLRRGGVSTMRRSGDSAPSHWVFVGRSRD